MSSLAMFDNLGQPELTKGSTKDSSTRGYGDRGEDGESGEGGESGESSEGGALRAQHGHARNWSSGSTQLADMRAGAQSTDLDAVEEGMSQDRSSSYFDPGSSEYESPVLTIEEHRNQRLLVSVDCAARINMC